jgi:hypothetical protein
MYAAQNRLAIPTWSYAMEMHPPARIIELGTYSGGFITALALHARFIGAKVVTYDRSPADVAIVPIGRDLGVDFRVCDMWQPGIEEEIAQLISGPGVSYVLCDGGDKHRELATFARYCKPGDVIAAHDYNYMLGSGAEIVEGVTPPWPWSETKIEHGAQVAADNALVPFYQDHFDMAGWLAYQKESNP